jgi:SOS response associated peptidase (SRAP)
MLLGSPLPGCNHQGRMQKRLSSRPSGVVESSRSGGRSDWELSPCADHKDGRLQKKSLLAATISRFHRNAICRSVGTLLQHTMSLRSGPIPRRSNEAWMLCSGLIPNWAKDPKIEYKTINARVETVDTAQSYRQAFKKRRCLIPADGFCEWKKALGGKSCAPAR